MIIKRTYIFLLVLMNAAVLVNCSSSKPNIQGIVRVPQENDNSDSLKSSPASAKYEFEFMGAKISYELPDDDRWWADEKVVDKEHPRQFLQFYRKIVYGSRGRRVMPSFGITCVKVRDNLTFDEFMMLNVKSLGLRVEMYNYLFPEDGAFKIKNATGFYYKTKQNGNNFTMIYCNMLKNGIGIIVACFATNDVFGKVEDEMLAIIKSIDIK